MRGGRGARGGWRGDVAGRRIDARPFTRLQCASFAARLLPACTHPPILYATLVRFANAGSFAFRKNEKMTFDIRVECMAFLVLLQFLFVN